MKARWGRAEPFTCDSCAPLNLGGFNKPLTLVIFHDALVMVIQSLSHGGCSAFSAGDIHFNSFLGTEFTFLLLFTMLHPLDHLAAITYPTSFESIPKGYGLYEALGARTVADNTAGRSHQTWRVVP